MWVGGGITGMGEIPMLGTTVKGLTALIKKIFYSGAQGFAYDPNDLTEEKIKWRRNLLTYSSKFDDISWSKSGISLELSSEVSPLGAGVPVYKLSSTSDTGFHQLLKAATFNKGDKITLSFYVKAGTAKKVDVFHNWVSSAGFDLEAGALISTNPLKKIVSVGNGWFRCTCTSIVPDNTSRTYVLRLLSNDGALASFTGETTLNMYIAGAQLEYGDGTAYQHITGFNSEFLRQFPLHALYQDAVGTIPVTAAGQPVGLMLDKSKGLALGSNIIPNGSFSSDTSWSKGAGWTIADGVARFDGSASFSNLGGVASPSINGKWLRVELDLSNVGALVTQVRILASGALAATIPVSGDGKYSAMILGGSVPSIGIQTQNASGVNSAFTLDNVSFKEVFGNHAYQTTSASRPILRQTPILGSELVTDNTLIASPAQSTIRYFNFSSKMPNLQAGKTYKIEYTLRNYAGGGVVGLSGNNPAGFSSFNQTANGTYSTVRDITANGSLLFVVAANTGVDVVDISVKEVTGYRTDQNYLEFDGSDDFLKTNNIDFSGTDKVSLFAGVRKLNDANTGILLELSESAESIANYGSFYIATPLSAIGSAVRSYSRGVNNVFALAAPLSSFQGTLPLIITSKSMVTGYCSLSVNKNVFFGISSRTGNYGNYPLYIGRRGGTSLPFNGHIYGLIGIGKVASDEETAVIEKELAKRVGVALNV